jgi:CspA family cold shock protein
MNFRDRPVTCSVCGKTYIFTVTEQRQLSESGQAVLDPQADEIEPPANCPSCRLRDPETGRWSGRIKWFSQEKGYGFIAKPNSDEVFFHRSQVVDEPLVSLEEGTPVTFEQVSTDRGEEARQVQVESA